MKGQIQSNNRRLNRHWQNTGWNWRRVPPVPTWETVWTFPLTEPDYTYTDADLYIRGLWEDGQLVIDDASHITVNLPSNSDALVAKWDAQSYLPLQYEAGDQLVITFQVALNPSQPIVSGSNYTVSNYSPFPPLLIAFAQRFYDASLGSDFIVYPSIDYYSPVNMKFDEVGGSFVNIVFSAVRNGAFAGGQRQRTFACCSNIIADFRQIDSQLPPISFTDAFSVSSSSMVLATMNFDLGRITLRHRQ